MTDKTIEHLPEDVLARVAQKLDEHDNGKTLLSFLLASKALSRGAKFYLDNWLKFMGSLLSMKATPGFSLVYMEHAIFFCGEIKRALWNQFDLQGLGIDIKKAEKEIQLGKAQFNMQYFTRLQNLPKGKIQQVEVGDYCSFVIVNGILYSCGKLANSKNLNYSFT